MWLVENRNVQSRWTAVWNLWGYICVHIYPLCLSSCSYCLIVFWLVINNKCEKLYYYRILSMVSFQIIIFDIKTFVGMGCWLLFVLCAVCFLPHLCVVYNGDRAGVCSISFPFKFHLHCMGKLKIAKPPWNCFWSASALKFDGTRETDRALQELLSGETMLCFR